MWLSVLMYSWLLYIQKSLSPTRKSIWLVILFQDLQTCNFQFCFQMCVLIIMCVKYFYLFDCFHREEVKQGYDTLLSQRWHLCTSCDKTLFTLMQDPFLPFHWFYDHKCCRQGNWYLEHKQCICIITRGYFTNLILYIRSS